MTSRKHITLEILDLLAIIIKHEGGSMSYSNVLDYVIEYDESRGILVYKAILNGEILCQALGLGDELHLREEFIWELLDYAISLEYKS